MKGGDFAKHLRRKATDAERKLWGHPRGRRFSGNKFRRQVPIGPYIADFLCFDPKLLIELDGNHHAFQADYDALRNRWFEEEGFRILRFSDRLALTEMDRVLESIWIALHDQSQVTLTRPAGTLSHQGRGKDKKEPILVPHGEGKEKTKLPSPPVGEGAGVRGHENTLTRPAGTLSHRGRGKGDVETR